MKAASPFVANKMETQYDDNDEDNYSDASSSLAPNGSVVSTVPDRHGFLGGTQYLSES